MKNTYKIFVTALVVLLSASCSFYKEYQRPDLQFVDSLYRRMEVLPDSISTAAISWDTFFTDSLLRMWINYGIQYNSDLGIARLKVQEAEAALLSARWAMLPGASFSAQQSLPGSFSASLNASWEADIFGSLRNNRRKAEAALEKSKAYEHAVQTQLVATIAESYYALLGLDEQLTISRRTLNTWEENIRTLDALKRAGKTNEAAVLQAKANKYSVEADVLTLEKKIMEMENSFCALISVVPMPIERSTLADQKLPMELSAGVPAEILARRPDVRQAELALAQCHYAKNIARAAFYPKVVLNGSIVGPGRLAEILIATLTQPVFGRGVNKANMAIAQAQYKEAAYSFRQCILNAGVEVNNALNMWQTAHNRVDIVKRQIISLQAAVWNTQLLMKHGNASYLEVLSAQKNLLNAELTETSDRLDEIRGMINLYHALGGGYEL